MRAMHSKQLSNWKPRRKRNTGNPKARPKVCELCHTRVPRRFAKHRDASGRLLCSPSCLTTYKQIAAILADNPRVPPKPVRLFILQRDGYTCAYCREPVSWRSSNIDHIKPWPGGKTRLTNLTTACPRCNKAKFRVRMTPDAAKLVSRGLTRKGER